MDSASGSAALPLLVRVAAWHTPVLFGLACARAVGGSATLAAAPIWDDCAKSHAADRDRRRAEAAARPERRSVRVWLIRHAQSQSNVSKGNLHNGRHIDVPLSSHGMLQAAALGRRLARSGEKVEAIYASEAIRTQQTAETVCAAINDPPPVTVMPTVDLGSAETARGICEIAMGAWTGKDKKECETAEVALAREHDCWEWQPHGLSEDEGLPGESYRDVEERVLRFLDGEHHCPCRLSRPPAHPKPVHARIAD